MSFARSRIAGLLLLATISACDSIVSAPAPDEAVHRANPGQERSATVRNLDHRFGVVSRSVPGFGGMFFDTVTSELNVYLRDPAQSAAAVSAIRAAFPERRVATAAVVIRRGRYGWRELTQWRERADALLSVPGVRHTDVDERLNRIRVGVENAALQRRVAVELDRMNVPLSAVEIEVRPRFRLTRTLRDLAPNLEGGLAVLNPIHATGASTCTAGFNVQYNGYYGFMVNSHCTTNMFEVNNTPFYQPDQSTGRYVGSESADPIFFYFGGEVRGGWLCPRGIRCRLSDAAVIRHESNAFGYGVIARTTFASTFPSDTGSITIDPGSPTLLINGEASAISGTRLSKIGQTTGWTSGSVVRTCSHEVAYAPDGSTFILMCQDVVGARATIGDSGAPVFATNLTGVTLYGLLWGSAYPEAAEFAFSPVANIRDEFGPIFWR